MEVWKFRSLITRGVFFFISFLDEGKGVCEDYFSDGGSWVVDDGGGGKRDARGEER